MPTPPHMPSPPGRIAALHRYGILDTPPEAAFDRLTELAAHWLDAPIALITLLDDERQWFKSCVGLDHRETDRDVAFCVHNLHDEDVLVVEDATQDPRFDDHPGVTGAPGIRAYAGAPLVTPSGYILGSLCVMDTTPRSFTADQTETLRKLAAVAIDEMELRVAETQRTDILESITDAFFTVDDDWRFTYVNTHAETILEHPREELLGRSVWDVFPDAADLPFHEQYHHAVRENESVHFEAYYGPLDVWVQVNAYPFDNGLSVYFRDVTERVQAEDERRMLAAAVEQAEEAVLITEGAPIDPPGPRIVYVNEAYEHLTGYTAEEVLGKTPRISQGPETDRAVLDETRACLEAGDPVQEASTVNYRKDGTPYWVTWSIAPLRDDDGSIEYWVSALRDVTEQRERREAVKAERERLELALIGGGLGMWDWNMNTDEVTYDARWAAILGYALDELDGTETFFADHTHPDDLARVRTATERHAAGETPHIDLEIRMRHKDGSWRWVLDRGRILEWNDDGTPRRMLGTHMDITQRKRAEEEARRQRDVLQNIFDASPAAITVLDAQGQITTANNQAQETLGLESSAITNRAFDDPAWQITDLEGTPLPDEDLPFARVMATGAAVHNVEHTIEWPDGTRRMLSINGAPLKKEDGTPEGAVFVLEDITERRAAERELRRQRDLLEQTQRLAGAWEYDLDSGALSWSEEIYRIHEVPPGTALQVEDGINFYAPEAQPVIQAAVERAIEEQEPWDLELPLITAEGNRRWVRAVGTAIEDAAGEVVKLAGAFQDVTERHEAQKEVEHSHERLARAHELISLGSWERDLEHGRLYWSDETYRILGQDPDHPLEYDAFMALVHPDDRPALRRQQERALAGEGDMDIEFRIRRPDGEERIVHERGTAVFADDGTPLRLTGTILDVTERRQEEEQMRLLEAAVENAADAILITEAEYDEPGPRIVYANTAFEEATGYTEDEVRGKTPRLLQGPETRRAPLNRMRAAFEQWQPVKETVLNYRKDGTQFWNELYVAPVTDEAGMCTHWVSIQRDVTEERIMRRTLAENKERFQALAEETTDTISRVDQKGTFLYLSPAVEHLLGYTPAALIGRTFHSLIHPDDIPEVEAHLAAALDGERVQLEYRVRHAAGHYRWVETTAQSVGHNGRSPTVITSTRSIERRKKVQRELQRERNLLQNIFDASPAAIMVFDAQGTVSLANAQVEGVLGRPVEAIVGQSFNAPMWRLAASDGAPLADADHPFATVMQTEEPLHGAEHTFQWPDGTERLLSVNGAPLHDEGDAVIGAVFVVEDITERRYAENELIRSKEAAEEARAAAEEMNRLKSALLANMSHEIRTPLTSIIGFSEVLVDLDLEEPAGQFSELIHSGGRRLLDTLNSVLDLAQLEAGAMKLHPKDVSVSQTVRSVVRRFERRAQKANVTLSTDLPEAPLTLHTDAMALERVLNNLVSNAIKFTGEGAMGGGRVEVALAERAPEPGERAVTLTVADTGTGIDADFLPELFVAFKQESTGDARQFEGSGLGLAITKELVDMMGGTIDVSSAKHEGTTFTVTLPYDAPPAS